MKGRGKTKGTRRKAKENEEDKALYSSKTSSKLQEELSNFQAKSNKTFLTFIKCNLSQLH